MKLMPAADDRKNFQLSYRKTATLVGLLFVTSTITFSVGSSMIQMPRWLSILGLAGYVVLLLGIPSDLSGFADLDSSAGALFYAPGGLFEIVLPLLLFVKGFDLPNTKDDL